jgi:hypothetical protein
MPKRVSSAISDKIHYVDSKICIYCRARTLPVRYKGGIASHFICTKCGIVQVDQSNPFLTSKDPQVYDRRKESAQIKLKSGNPTGEIDIGSIKKVYKKPIEKVFTNESEIETIVKNPSQVSGAINRSLSQLRTLEKQKEMDTRLILREKFGRSVPK